MKGLFIILLFLVENSTKYVLFKFNVNRLALNHSFIILSNRVNSYSIQLGFLTIILISSAKRMGIDLLFTHVILCQFSFLVCKTQQALPIHTTVIL
jgi:hypothetical protein